MDNSTASFVIGGGPVGMEVFKQLHSSGEDVVLISRAARDLPDGARQIEGSISDPGVQDQIPHGVTLYHCANAPYHRWQEELPGLWSTILKLAETRNALLIVATNLYAFGKPNGSFTENSPLNPCTAKGAVRKQVEEQVLDSIRNGRVRGALVRASDFFGPGVLQTALGERFFTPIIRGKRPTLYGNLDAPHSYTYVPDFAGTMIGAARGARNASSRGRDQWIVPSTSITSRELIRVLSELTGRSLSPGTMGAGMLKFAGLFVPEAKEMVEMLYEFTDPFVADGERARKELGIEPTDLRSALATTLEWFGTSNNRKHKTAA